jgi:DNA-binding CsgD family transcriptional regulator
MQRCRPWPASRNVIRAWSCRGWGALDHACHQRCSAIRGASQSRIDSLTPSERRIAQLAAAGLSNRYIAQNLFITARTVEGHLTHAYQKLAITSREQLPALTPPDGKTNDPAFR